MPKNTIITCLEQKVIFMTKILDITKQIEVRCQQDDIVLDDFLEQRESFMNRVDKCNQLIDKCLQSMEDEGLQTKIKQALSRTIDDCNCSSDEKMIFDLSKQLQELLKKTINLNKTVNMLLKNQHDEMQIKLNEIRKSKSQNNSQSFQFK